MCVCVCVCVCACVYKKCNQVMMLMCTPLIIALLTAQTTRSLVLTPDEGDIVKRYDANLFQYL